MSPGPPPAHRHRSSLAPFTHPPEASAHDQSAAGYLKYRQATAIDFEQRFCNLPWALGGYEYGGSINQIFNGWIGDIRIVSRALRVDEVMIAG
jgi:hypothetical protein